MRKITLKNCTTTYRSPFIEAVLDDENNILSLEPIDAYDKEVEGFIFKSQMKVEKQKKLFGKFFEYLIVHK